MTYVTIDELIARFGQDELLELTDRAGEGVLDDQIVEAAILDAEAEIDGYISTAATLPMLSRARRASGPCNHTRASNMAGASRTSGHEDGSR